MTAEESSQVPITVGVDLNEPALQAYWHDRARQHLTDSYAGVRLSKFPEDLRVYEHLLWLSGADSVVELGVQFGGSALWFRDRLLALSRYGRRVRRVVGVELDASAAREELDRADPAWGDSITIIEGDVRDPELPARVRSALGSEARPLVVEDAAHTYEVTLAGITNFAPLVAPGGFLVVEDACVDDERLQFAEDLPHGVAPAIEHFLSSDQGRAFRQRGDLELYGITCHPGGYLERVSATPRAPSPAPASTPSSEISDGLRAEIEAETGFMYPWRLGGEGTIEPIHPELASIHATRAELIEAPVRGALAGGGRVADLGAHEGWFSQRALEWGADFVLGVDVRELNVRRARLLRDHFGISPERLEFVQASVHEVDPAARGAFDVVLALGLIYHLEDPIGALRVAAGLLAPGGLLVVETQLTRAGPVRHGWGTTGTFHDEPASWAARFEPLVEQRDLPLASHGGVISLIPNRAAVLQALETLGLTRIETLKPGPGHNRQYIDGDRALFIARARPRPA